MMWRLFFGCLIVMFTAAVPTEMENGFFTGRSGDILLRQEGIDTNGQLYLSAPSSRVRESVETLPQTQIADLISYLSASPLLSSSSEIESRDMYPVSDLFHRAPATVLLTIPGVSQDTFVEAGLNGLPEWGLEHTMLSVKRNSFPVDAAADVMTALTGRTPSEHGIVAGSWMHHGEEVAAFSSASTGARAATFLEVAAADAASIQHTPLILSASANNAVAAAGAVKGDGSAVFSVDKKTGLMRMHSSNVETLSNAQSSDVLSLDVEEDRTFLVELEFFKRVHDFVESSESLRRLVHDRVADTYVLTFSSLEALIRKYGEQSAQVKDALTLVDRHVPAILADISSLYGGKAATAVYLTGRMAEVSPATVAVVESALTSMGVDAQTSSPAQSSARSANVVYLRPDTMLQKRKACAAVTQAVADDVAVVCMARSPRQESIELFTRDINTIDLPSNTTIYDTSEVMMFQATLWGAILVTLIMCGGACAIYNMDVPEDPLLYTPAKAQ